MAIGALTLLTFLAAALGVGAAYSVCADLMRRDRDRVYSRMEQELGRPASAEAVPVRLVQDWDTFDLGPLARPASDHQPLALAPARAATGIVERFRVMLAQSGLPFTPAQVLLAACAAALLAAVIVGWVGGILLIVPGAVAGGRSRCGMSARGTAGGSGNCSGSYPKPLN